MNLPAVPERSVVTGLAKIGLALRQEAWAAASGHGLHPTQAQILALLRMRPRSLSEVAAELGVTAPTASKSVAALVRKRLVAKRRSSSDGRVLQLTPTPRGERVALATALWPDEFLAAAEDLSAEEQAVLLRSLTKILRRLQEQGRISTTRMCATCRFFRPYAHDDRERPHHCALVDAAFGERALRLECDEHEPAPVDEAESIWKRFASGSTR